MTGRNFSPENPSPIAVRITNRSGQKLKLGTDDSWLTFSVETREGAIAVKTADMPVEEEFVLEPSKRAIKHIDLEPYFAVGNPGRYLVSASVHIKEWNQDIRSQPKGFDVLEGTRLWEQNVGIPKAPGSTNAVPEVRKYVTPAGELRRQQASPLPPRARRKRPAPA